MPLPHSQTMPPTTFLAPLSLPLHTSHNHKRPYNLHHTSPNLCSATNNTPKPCNITKAPHLTDYLPNLEPNKNPARRRPEIQQHFIHDGDLVRSRVVVEQNDGTDDEFYCRAGPRAMAYFRRDEVRAAIVSCGGLSPGINCTIREIVRCLANEYSVDKIFGIRNGYQGFWGSNWMELNAEVVEDIQKAGGTILGTSRGGFDARKIVDACETRGVNQLYAIGGDGTISGLEQVYSEVRRRKLKCAVVSVPKTIDADIDVIDKTFGFATAVEESQRAISAAAIEAKCFPNGVAIVQLMGRNSGFIAMHASLASLEVDACLIPETPFAIHGKGGVLEYVEETLDKKGHVVIVVAEGAGGEHVRGAEAIGTHLNTEIKSFVENDLGRVVSMKYLNPTYAIRAIRTIASDRIFCTTLAHDCVHGAFAGLTGFVTGPVNGVMSYIPLSRVAGRQKKVDPNDLLWMKLIACTGQPNWATPGSHNVEAEKVEIAT